MASVRFMLASFLAVLTLEPIRITVPVPLPQRDRHRYSDRLLASSSTRADTDPKPITLHVLVPADAQVEFDGQTTQSTGESRSFLTPPVAAGKEYSYSVRATSQGKSVTGTFVFRHGGKNTLDLRSEFQAKASSLSEEEARQLGIEAVIYGLPLVVMDVTRQVMTNVTEPQPGGKAPVNQPGNLYKYPTPEFRDVVRPNVDTLYTNAWLDLTKEPIVLSVPDTQGRYYLMQMLDGWTNVFASPGKRTTGTGAGEFAITGPNWVGSLPDGVRELKSPTNMVWMIGRTQADGPADYASVNAIQKQYKLTPLSAYGTRYSPPITSVDPAVAMKTPPIEQVAKMTAAAFFGKLAALMKSNPPSPADGPTLAKLARIGVVPGQPFDLSKRDPAVARGLEGCVQTAMQRLQSASKMIGKPINGWRIPPMFLGEYGTEYGARAVVALIALGANVPADAVYPSAFVDGEGDPLNGNNRYVLHFEPEQGPPARAFWSLTMYDAQSFLVDNPIQRYNIAGWMPLKRNPDGSLDITIQRDSPGKEKEANWLPAAASEFNVTLRIYWPKEMVLDGTWKPPAIRRVP